MLCPMIFFYFISYSNVSICIWYYIYIMYDDAYIYLVIQMPIYIFIWTVRSWGDGGRGWWWWWAVVWWQRCSVDGVGIACWSCHLQDGGWGVGCRWGGDVVVGGGGYRGVGKGGLRGSDDPPPLFGANFIHFLYKVLGLRSVQKKTFKH